MFHTAVTVSHGVPHIGHGLLFAWSSNSSAVIGSRWSSRTSLRSELAEDRSCLRALACWDVLNDAISVSEMAT